MTQKDFSQVAFEVVRKAVGDQPRDVPPEPVQHQRGEAARKREDAAKAVPLNEERTVIARRADAAWRRK